MTDFYYQKENERKTARPEGSIVIPPEIRLAIEQTAKSVVAALKENEPIFTSGEIKSVKQHHETLTEIGSGNPDRGAVIERENHKFISERVDFEGEVKKWTVRGLVLAVLSGVLSAIVVGFKAIVKTG